MSTEIRENVLTLIKQVEQGKLLEAFDAFYADSVAMQENSNAPTVGKAANRAREEQFVASVAEVHEARAKRWSAGENHAAIEWVVEFTSTEGTRLRMEQVALQTWENGKIVHERFYYDTASLIVQH
jgi:ketosteroid isomerase-like protein